MAEDKYYRLIIKNISTRNEELVSHFCISAGASGVTEELEFDQSDDAFNVKTIDKDSHDINVYFESPPQEDFFIRLQSEFPGLEIQLKTEENKDWMAEWKKGFHSFELCEDSWVVPSWEQQLPNVKHILRIDPGMAFGTGTHETTKLVAGLLNDLPVQKSLLDVGTGTGIIALLAEKKGFQNIEATEIDDLARHVAKENVQLNKSCVKVLDIQIESLKNVYDVVVANIIDGVLVQIQKDLTRLVRPGGYLLLSGILKEREPGFSQKFDALKSYRVIKRETLGEWVSLLLEDPNA